MCLFTHPMNNGNKFCSQIQPDLILDNIMYRYKIDGSLICYFFVNNTHGVIEIMYQKEYHFLVLQ